MQPADRNHLTAMRTSGSPETVETQVSMDGSTEKPWSKRYNWAACREPYKTELDALASQWIEGALSNEELAFEAVQMLSELEWVGQPGKTTPRICLDDVIGQVKILTEAMLGVSERPRDMQTSDLRRQAMDFMRAEFGKEQDLSR